MKLLRRTLAVLGAVVPTLAAEVAWQLFVFLGKPAAVHERDRAVHLAATVGRLELHGQGVTTYSWGTGPAVILLVHGWRSRASRLSALVTTLSSPGRTIVSFDAPGNGASPGRRTTVLDYADLIRMLGEKHGEFDAIVGHSFGVLATFLAVREGVRTRRIVAVAGMHAATQLVRAFSRQLGLSSKVENLLRRNIERRTFPLVTDPWSRFVSRLDSADIPLMIVHDADDAAVDVGEAALIAAAHPGEVTTRLTSGLGHSRVLSDGPTLDAIAEFVAGSAPTRANRSRETAARSK